MTESRRTVYRTCPLCEATCGLKITLHEQTIERIEGDADNSFSRGFICPKGASLKHLQDDPDRLQRPMLREGDEWREITWSDAFAWVEEHLQPLRKTQGNDAVGVYLGNPNVHNVSNAFFLRPFLKALRTRNIFSASTVDQMPRHVSCGLMYGHPGAIPVPDLDRTDYLLMLGANPLVSNGSLCTAPDFPGRLKAIKARGGRVVVVDPRRTKTARKASEHLFIKPGTDALFLAALAHVLCAEGRVRVGELADHLGDLETLVTLFGAFTPERVAPVCGIEVETIRRIARELSDAPRACVYGRIGNHTVRFGTVSSWLADVLNVLTGNLDRPGGVMFPLSAHSRDRVDREPGGRGWSTGRWTSRVKKYPEVMGELPVVTLVDEIETAGAGQIRALVTVAGNPVRSTPNSQRLEAAFRSLDVMISIDPYLNETTRLAHLILPPPPPLHRSHYDVAFYDFAVRNFAHYSPPTFPLGDALSESEILLRLSAIAAGQGPDVDPAMVEHFVLMHLLNGRKKSDDDVSDDTILSALGTRRGVARILDYLIRMGPYGDRFGARAEGLSLADLEAAPHGVDLGPLKPLLPALLKTASGKVELTPAALVEDLKALEHWLDDASQVDTLVMIGRRHLRSNNSWMHNIPRLVGGHNRCTVQIHQDDATARQLNDGDMVRVQSRVGAIELPVEITHDIMPGVVCIPHGWGHDVPETRLSVAQKFPGANVNILTDEAAFDPLSGNAVLNGVPVDVRAL